MAWNGWFTLKILTRGDELQVQWYIRGLSASISAMQHILCLICCSQTVKGGYSMVCMDVRVCVCVMTESDHCDCSAAHALDTHRYSLACVTAVRALR